MKYRTERFLTVLAAVALSLSVWACSGGSEADVGDDNDVAAEVKVACETDDECKSADPCRKAVCKEGFCGHEFTKAACDDGDPCTEDDQCSQGVCAGTDKVCDDGLFCNGEESCDSESGDCIDGFPPDMNDDIECTVDQCDEETDEVLHTADDALCSDDNQCTEDICDPAAGCVNTVVTVVCDDGDLCTDDDLCVEGECKGVTVECSDGEFCNGEESCDPESGGCLEGAAPEIDDGLDCTVDACDEAVDEVTHTPDDVVCDDGEQCTVDSCVVGQGCVYENVEGSCDDGNECTEGDACDDGLCLPGEFICFEDCVNEMDDDQDELVDCEDPDCTWDLACMDGGESCALAYPLNEAKPLMLGDEVSFAASTVGFSNEYDGSCSAATALSADAVHILELGEPLGLKFTVDFDGQAWPALYVLADDCEKELFCTAANSTAPKTAATVHPAGLYYIVVDGAFKGDEGNYELYIETFAPAATEVVCTNNVDDDADGKVDCADEDCSNAPQCQQKQGETCSDALNLFDSPVMDDGNVWNAVDDGTTKEMKNDLSGSCDVDSGQSPDVVYTFVLLDPMWLEATHDFAGQLWPAMYLFSESCEAGQEVGCAKAVDGAALLSLPLAAGTYFLVLDGAYPGDAGPYTVTAALSSLADSEGDCSNGFDDDMDGMVDCDDDDCLTEVGCVGFPGDNCNMAFLINDGKPITSSAAGSLLLYQGTTEGVNDDFEAPCDPDTAVNPDVVYKVHVAEPLVVTFSHDFDGTMWPALMLLDDNCSEASVLACETGFSGAATIVMGLQPGDYYAVLDSQFPGEAGDYTFAVSFALPEPWETNCGDAEDEDLDGLVDCEDEDCQFDMLCMDPYEKNNTFQEAYDLGVLGEQGFVAENGTMIHPGKDEDWFLFEVTGPGHLQVVATPQDALDLKLVLANGAGVELVTEDTGDGGEAETLGYAVYESGVFAVAVRGWNVSTGSYSLSISLLEAPAMEAACDDEVDDDLDGKVDCDDEDCKATVACGAGDSCDNPLGLNLGLPVDASFDGLQLIYEGTTVGKVNDLTGSCSQESGEAPDVVWEMTLAQAMDVSITVDFEGFKWPTLYLLKDSCQGEELDCIPGETEPITIQASLEAGNYFIVIDGNWPNDASAYSLSVLFGAPALAESDCADGFDNDNNGFIDCADEQCWLDPICAGETCSTPFTVNDGAALTQMDDGLHLEYTGDTTGMGMDLSASCSEESLDGADVVYVFTLETQMQVDIAYDFEGIFYPALALFADDCLPESELECVTETFEPAVIGQKLLEPGTYYILLDADWAGDEGPYSLALDFVLPVTQETDCGDGIDNDLDGLLDCTDDDCAWEPACEGETCVLPFLLNSGDAVTAADDGLELVQEGDTTGMSDELSGSCDPDSAEAPEAVYQLDLADNMIVTVSHDFAGTSAWPALYIFAGDCLAGSQIACATGQGGAAWLEGLGLQAGTYFVVVDAGWAGDEEAYTLTIQFQSADESETDCADGLDNDANGFADCLDEQCALDPACEGETCTTAFVLNEGVPISQADDGLQLVVAGDTSGMSDDLSGSCDVDTGTSPDAVYSFTLSDSMFVAISHDFAGTTAWPAVYLFEEVCTEDAELACAAASGDAALIEAMVLGPGTYFVVLDASWDGDQEAYTLTLDFLAPAASELDCADGIDNDANGATDCCDEGCILDPACVESICSNLKDDDCDGTIDCEDLDCSESPACSVAALPYPETFEHGGEWADGFTTGSPNDKCAWAVEAGGADGTEYAMKLTFGSNCSQAESYNLYSPYLDVSACNEISVTFYEKGEWVSDFFWHGLGLDDGGEAPVLDLLAPTTNWLVSGPYAFDVSGADTIRVFFAYMGAFADNWYVDQVLVECSQ